MGKSILCFSASWCKSCQSIKQDILAIKSRLELDCVDDATNDTIFKGTNHPSLVYIDVDDDPSISDTYNVQALPCFLFIDQSEHIAFRYEGSDLDRINTYINAFVLDDKESFASLVAQEVKTDTPSSEADDPNSAYPELDGVRMSDRIPVTDIVNSLEGHSHSHHAANELLQGRYGHQASPCPSGTTSLIAEKDMFEYLVPMLSKDGTCSNSAILSPHPFNLATNVYKLKSLDGPEYERRLAYLTKLHHVVNLIYQVSNHAEWIGIYRLLQIRGSGHPHYNDGTRVLVKEAYKGA